MATDKKIEQFLRKHGVKFEYRAKLKITDIDIESSRRNQVRTGQHVDDDQVLVYGIAMDSGDTFPPIIVDGRKMPKGKGTVVDGNHRLKAITDCLELKTCEAYVITDATELQMLRLLFKSNQTNGLALTMDDRVRHAAILVAHGATQKDAATDIGIPHTRLQTFLKRQDTENRLTALGVKRIDKMTDTVLTRLSSVRDDDVMKELATTVIRYTVPTQEFERFLPKLNKERTKEGQVKLVKELANAYEREEKVRGGKGSPIKRLPAVVTTLRRATGSLLRLTDSEVQTVPAELKADLEVACRNSAQRLIKIADQLH